MNGPHDMGGFTRFGPVKPDATQPVFHHNWERRVLALTLATDALGQWNIDILRHARESLPPQKYWYANYYDIRIEAHIKVMIERGLITESEIATGRMETPSKPVKMFLEAGKVAGVLAKGSPYIRDVSSKPQFKVGDIVKPRNLQAKGHTRLPRYARGKYGEIIAVHGAHVFPDSSAHGQDDDPQWLYTVRFTAKELWGHNNNDSVMLDLWEPYLEHA